ncbi:MAG: DDE-type integrase/transposase/recombinase [Gemmatimonadetes bacterium]|nr:DDE-type integrase/transposase/recombinase [Gemmatimonadota bacterium]
MSPATGQRYPVTMICTMWRVARSTVYARRLAETGLNRDALRASQSDDRHGGRDRGTPAKRGPRTPLDDATLLVEIRAVLKASGFCTEGHRKVRARLRPRGIRVGKARVLRLMRQANLLAPTRRRHRRGDRAHAGTITTPRPDELWGTDATRFYTRREGWCWFFGAIDHGVEDIVGWHVAKVGDRWAALEPIRQGVQRTHGQYAPKIALGLGLRMDWGPQYTAHQFLGELRWLGIRPSPSYVGEPECTGIMERWIRTLKEECLYLHDFATLDAARQVIGEFIERYNQAWLLERHGYRTPADVRLSLTRRAA